MDKSLDWCWTHALWPSHQTCTNPVLFPLHYLNYGLCCHSSQSPSLAEMMSALLLINAAVIISLKKKRMLKTKWSEGTGPSHSTGVPTLQATTSTFSGQTRSMSTLCACYKRESIHSLLSQPDYPRKLEEGLEKHERGCHSWDWLNIHASCS